METGGLIDSSCSGFLLVDSLHNVLSVLPGEYAFVKTPDDFRETKTEGTCGTNTLMSMATI